MEELGGRSRTDVQCTPPPGASLLLPPWQRNTPKQQKAVATLTFAIALRPRYIFFLPL